MRDKIEISTQLLRADVADESLVETRRAGNRDAGIRTGRDSKNVERDSRAFVVSAISTVIIRTAKQMAVAGAFFGVCAAML